MYNNPYYYPYMNIPIQNNLTGIKEMTGIMNPIRPTGIFRSSLFKGFSNIKWTDVLNNTQKTLNIINQAIPVYYQVKPIFCNIKSLGRLMTAFNEDDTKERNNQEIKKEDNSNSPTFFIN